MTDITQADRDFAAEACGLFDNKEARKLIGCFQCCTRDADGVMRRTMAGWNPDTNRDHLAVVLQEVERQGLLKEVDEALAVENDTVCLCDCVVNLLHLFANDPAVIVGACIEALRQTRKGA